MFFTALKIIGAVLAGAAIIYAVDKLIDKDVISSQMHNNYPNALKALIHEKKENAVVLGIFDSNNNEIESNIELKSSVGISNSLYVGQEIYL